MSVYGESYYKKMCTHVRDVERPVRKMLRTPVLFLPADAPVSVFGFDNIEHIKKWKRIFGYVYVYEINEYTVKLAKGIGIGDTFFLQDVSKRFESKSKTDVAVCEYLFEHLSDQQCVDTIAKKESP